MEKTNKPDPDSLNHFSVEPLTIANWSKFVRLFGDNGAYGNCWCMHYRMNKAAFEIADRRSKNRPMIRYDTSRNENPT
jgi:hypothetical protein